MSIKHANKISVENVVTAQTDDVILNYELLFYMTIRLWEAAIICWRKVLDSSEDNNTK
jgi:hypothetical protein